MTSASIQFLLPEILLLVAAVTIYLGGAFFNARRRWRWVAVIGLAMAALVLARQQPGVSADGAIAFDQLTFFGRWLGLGFGLLLILIAFRPLHLGGTPEYLGSLLLIVVGLMLVASAKDLVLLFLALELISIPTYIVLYLGRRDAASQESAAKYFFLSVLASAVLLYGFSFLYGTAGSTNLANIRLTLAGQVPAVAGLLPLGKLALVLVFAGLCFRIAAVPFHFYAPDVYQGTSQVNAALLSVIPKAAGLLAMVRLFDAILPGSDAYAWRTVLVIAVLTMTFGNVLALWQDDLRRLLAYSSIANAGYMLLALAVGLVSRDSMAGGTEWNALWFYLAVYALGTIGAFAVLEHLGRPGLRIDGVEELAGLARTRPAAAGVLAVCMFSLAGIPVLAGFWGKFLVFGGALYVQPAAAGGFQWWFVGAAVIGVLNAAIAAAYYLRIVGVMYFRAPLATPPAGGGYSPGAVGLVCALLLVVGGIFPQPLMSLTSGACPSGPKLSDVRPVAEAGEKRATTPACPMIRGGGEKRGTNGQLPAMPAT